MNAEGNVPDAGRFDATIVSRLRAVLSSVERVMGEIEKLRSKVLRGMAGVVPSQSLDWSDMLEGYRSIIAAFSSTLKNAEAACGRDVATLHTSMERVEASLGRKAAAMGQAHSTNLLVFPRAVTAETAQEMQGMLSASGGPDISQEDAQHAGMARAEAGGSGDAALEAALVLGVERLRAAVAHLTSDSGPADPSTGAGVLSARAPMAAQIPGTLACVLHHAAPHEREMLGKKRARAQQETLYLTKAGQDEVYDATLPFAL